MELGSLTQVLFLGIGAGITLGLRLDGRRDVVVKWLIGDELHLTRAYAIQEEIRLAGFPCARLLKTPAHLGSGRHVVVHELFAPGREATISPAIRREIASVYVHLLQFSRDLSGNGLQVFEPKLDGETIERFPGLSEEIVRLRDTRPYIVAHGDWKMRNLLFCNDRISAIFDFDALQMHPELMGVAATAVNFMRRRGTPTTHLCPELTHAFLQDFERARREKLSDDEVREIRVWALYNIVMRRHPRALQNAPADFLVARVKRFDEAVGAIWPRWRAAGDF